MTTLVVFATDRWLRIADGSIVARGDAETLAPLTDDVRVVAILAGADATIGSASLGMLTGPQANAAAGAVIAERSLTASDTLHCTAGSPDVLGQCATVAIEAAIIRERIEMLAVHGLDPDAMLVAPLILARPASGFARATVDEELIWRSSDAAFADDAAITPLIVGDADVITIEGSALEAALVAAVTLPELNLRHGRFSKRRRWSIDLARVRRLAALLLALGSIILATAIAQTARTNSAAERTEREAISRAAAVLPPASVVTAPATQVEARLAELGGGGGGFMPLASVAASAVQQVTGAELSGMAYTGAALQLTVRATSIAELEQVEARLASAGLVTEAAPVVADQSRPYRTITVRGR